MTTTLADVGTAALLLALLLSLYATGASFWGARRERANWIESAKNATFVVFGLLSLAVIIMEYFLLTGQFQVEYVAHYTALKQPFIYNLSALWGGQEGSLLARKQAPDILQNDCRRPVLLECRRIRRLPKELPGR